MLDHVPAVRRGVFGFIGIAACAMGARAQSPRHRETSNPYSIGPATNAALDSTISAAAREYAGMSVDRVAFFDFAIPRDSTEMAALHGRALLVVTAIAHDSAELPLRRVYVRDGSTEHPVTLVAGVRSVVSPETLEGATLGAYRVDAIYLLPVALVVHSGDLLADFAVHRSGFRIGTFRSDVPATVRALAHMPVASSPPPLMEVVRMLEREYPDLADALR